MRERGEKEIEKVTSSSSSSLSTLREWVSQWGGSARNVSKDDPTHCHTPIISCGKNRKYQPIHHENTWMDGRYQKKTRKRRGKRRGGKCEKSRWKGERKWLDTCQLIANGSLGNDNKERDDILKQPVDHPPAIPLLPLPPSLSPPLSLLFSSPSPLSLPCLLSPSLTRQRRGSDGEWPQQGRYWWRHHRDGLAFLLFLLSRENERDRNEEEEKGNQTTPSPSHHEWERWRWEEAWACGREK